MLLFIPRAGVVRHFVGSKVQRHALQAAREWRQQAQHAMPPTWNSCCSSLRPSAIWSATVDDNPLRGVEASDGGARELVLLLEGTAHAPTPCGRSPTRAAASEAAKARWPAPDTHMALRLNRAAMLSPYRATRRSYWGLEWG